MILLKNYAGDDAAKMPEKRTLLAAPLALRRRSTLLLLVPRRPLHALTRQMSCPPPSGYEKRVSYSYRTATTAYPCSLPRLGGIQQELVV